MQDVPRYTYRQTVAADAIRYGGGSGLGAVLKLLAGNRMFRVTFTLRSCQAADRMGGPLRKPLLAVCRLLHRWTQHSAAMDLPWETKVGPGLRILHGWGLVVNASARIGANVTLFHGVTLGQKDDLLPSGRVTHYPELGDGVWVGPHAVIIGVSVGDECIVAASTVVTKPVPRRTVVAGNPGKPVAEVTIPDIPHPAPVGAPAIHSTTAQASTVPG